MRVWVCDEAVCIKGICAAELQEPKHVVLHEMACPGATTLDLKAIERDPFLDDDGRMWVQIRPKVRVAVVDQSGGQICFPIPHNILVGHKWRLMADWSVFRNWFLSEGGFVQANPDVRRFVTAHFQEADAVVAMGNLFSATDRLLKAALKAEGVLGEILTETLPPVLKFCTSGDRRYFNLIGMCCDPRSIYVINTCRIGVEHGDYSRDQRELRQGGWNPKNPDKEYLEFIEDRLLGAHSKVCRIFDQVDPETGLFLKNWEPRGFGQCQHKIHNKDGRTPDEPEQPDETVDPRTPLSG